MHRIGYEGPFIVLSLKILVRGITTREGLYLQATQDKTLMLALIVGVRISLKEMSTPELTKRIPLT